MILSFANLHMFLGLKPTAHNSNYHRIHFSQEIDLTNINSYLADFGATLIYCVEVLTREGEQDRLFEPTSMWGEALNITFSLIVYVQILFFLLALRRHFKR